MNWQQQVDLLEHFAEHIGLKYEHWLFTDIEDKSVEAFVRFCKDETVRDLNAPRGQDKKSYLERAEDERSRAS